MPECRHGTLSRDGRSSEVRGQRRFRGGSMRSCHETLSAQSLATAQSGVACFCSGASCCQILWAFCYCHPFSQHCTPPSSTTSRGHTRHILSILFPSSISLQIFKVSNCIWAFARYFLPDCFAPAVSQGKSGSQIFPGSS